MCCNILTLLLCPLPFMLVSCLLSRHACKPPTSPSLALQMQGLFLGLIMGTMGKMNMEAAASSERPDTA